MSSHSGTNHHSPFERGSALSDVEGQTLIFSTMCSSTPLCAVRPETPEQFVIDIVRHPPQIDFTS